MSLSAHAKRLRWVLTGSASGGVCPECGRQSVTVRRDGWACERCPATGPLPPAPGWR